VCGIEGEGGKKIGLGVGGIGGIGVLLGGVVM